MIRFLVRPRFGILDLTAVLIAVKFFEVGQYLASIIVVVIFALVGAAYEAFSSAT